MKEKLRLYFGYRCVDPDAYACLNLYQQIEVQERTMLRCKGMIRAT